MAEEELIAKRREKIEALKEAGLSLYCDEFRVTSSAREITEKFGPLSAEELAKEEAEWALAGRIMSIRDFGKASFFHLKDASGAVQAFVSQETSGKDQFIFFKKLDIGDIVGVKGVPFRTRTGELTLKVSFLRLLTKSLRPLPEKWHGLTDIEVRYRQRYLDLIANPAVKEVFLKRARIVDFIRQFLKDQGFLEVETPMMHGTPGGAAARPFKTYHNALEMELYLRIAPELYLKRLLVGGLERVFEINRNFRNEGLDSEHNPEFTMVEFYLAYADYNDLMALTEEMLSSLALELLGTTKVKYQGSEIDLTPPWERITLGEALIKKGGVPQRVLTDAGALIQMSQELGVCGPETGPGKALASLLEKLVVPKLVHPAFVLDYPTEVSPLARRSERDPEVVERFELFIAGKEIANAFSELTDPLEQRERFREQTKAKEAEGEGHPMDEEFLKALEYGMPPAAGEGIGIDRLVMILTDSPSIRDVILFPQLRPER